MRLAPRSLACVFALTVAAPAALAQQQGERARLDDFALPAAPAASDQIGVEQVGPAARAVAPAQQLVDRSLTVAAPLQQGDAPLSQIASAEGAAPTVQLTDRSASGLVAPAVSSTGDSRPTGVQRLAGSDRCDPQQDAARRAECLGILELRAEEFNAPRAPQLSAEQRLLAEERAREEAFGSQSASLRLRYATVADPDANLDSNQELASIYLERPATPSTTGQPEAPTETGGGDLGSAILEALGIPVPPPG